MPERKGLEEIRNGPSRWVSFRTLDVAPDWSTTPCVKVMLDGTFELPELELICNELRRLHGKETEASE